MAGMKIMMPDLCDVCIFINYHKVNYKSWYNFPPAELGLNRNWNLLPVQVQQGFIMQAVWYIIYEMQCIVMDIFVVFPSFSEFDFLDIYIMKIMAS